MNNYDKDNPTIGSLLYMLNSMTKEYEEYKKIGTVEEFRKLKADNTETSNTNLIYDFEKEIGFKNKENVKWISSRDANINDSRKEEWEEQRKKYGFDNREMFNLDSTICLFLYNHLKRFQQIAKNMQIEKWVSLSEDVSDEWYDTLQKMIDGFAEYIRLDIKEDEKDLNKTDQAFKLLTEWYQMLWI